MQITGIDYVVRKSMFFQQLPYCDRVQIDRSFKSDASSWNSVFQKFHRLVDSWHSETVSGKYEGDDTNYSAAIKVHIITR
ncbi:hypothetical protein KBC03_08340 [Patescibacteria group bacterium]|nr:hypothetical protein [Patescibacteria group bacterium]